jgi:hypothetical protein
MITLSYSGLKNLECPFRFHTMQVARTHKEPPTPEMELGSAVHKAIEALLLSGRTILCPEGVDEEKYRSMVYNWKVSEFATVTRSGGSVEVKTAMDSHERRCDFASAEAVLRGIFDYYYLDGFTPTVVDWKTGHWEVDPKQTQFYAVLALANEPEAEQVETVVYNVSSNTITRRTYSREEIAETRDEILAISRDVNSRTEWPAKPCWLCDRCTVPECPEKGSVSTTLLQESKLPILRVPCAVSTQSEAETALRFVLFAESIVDQIKGLLKGYAETNGTVYAAGKTAGFVEKESWKPKDLAGLMKTLSAWGAPKDLLWDNLSLTKAALEKIIKKAGIKDREPAIKEMLEIKTSRAFSITKDRDV